MHFKLETCILVIFFFFFNILHQNRGPIVKMETKTYCNQSTSVKSKLLQGTCKCKVDTFYHCLAWNYYLAGRGLTFLFKVKSFGTKFSLL